MEKGDEGKEKYNERIIPRLFREEGPHGQEHPEAEPVQRASDAQIPGNEIEKYSREKVEGDKGESGIASEIARHVE